MSANDISPVKAGELANAVYAVNSGNRAKMLAFLGDPIFASGKGSRQLLKAEVGGRIIKATEDMFGLCAVGGGAYANDVFLIFRGTTEANGKADFLTDARLGLMRSKTGMSVHIGFNHAFNSMQREISDFIRSSKTTGRVHCVGHSLGGAVASIAADWVSTNLKRPVSLYTFGQPRVGLSMFSAALSIKLGKDNIHRVFHTTDPVPMVPVFPYVHAPLPGYGLRVMSGEAIHSGAAHKMQSYEDDMGAHADWSSLNSAKPIFNHEHAIRSWLTSKISDDPSSSKTYEMLEKALIWILARIGARLASGIHFAAMGIHSFVDIAAYILAKGIEIAKDARDYVMMFIRKAMKVLGIKFQEGVTKYSKSFIRFILQSLIRNINDMAQKAVRSMMK